MQHERHRRRRRRGQQDRQRAHDGADPLQRFAHARRDDSIRVRATDLELTLEQRFPGRDRRGRQRHRSGQTVQRLPGQLAARARGAHRHADARQRQVRTLELRFSRAARRRVSAAALVAEGRPRSRSTPSGFARAWRHDLRRLERRSARRGADGHVARNRRRQTHDGRDRRIPSGQMADDAGARPRGRTPVKYIVPSRALAEAARNLGGAETRGDLGARARPATNWRSPPHKTSIVVRLVDGQYPNYGQVIPAQFDRSVTVNTSALIAGLRRAELVAGDRASMVKIERLRTAADHHRQQRHDRQRLRRTRGRADRAKI